MKLFKKKVLFLFFLLSVTAFVAMDFLFASNSLGFKIFSNNTVYAEYHSTSNASDLKNTIENWSSNEELEVYVNSNITVSPFSPISITVKSGTNIVVNFGADIRALSSSSNPFSNSLFIVEDGATLKFTSKNNKGVMQVNANCNGGVVYVKSGGKFILDGSLVSFCGSTANGGAFYGEEGSIIEINRGSIILCSAGLNGGGIYSQGTVNCINTLITACSAGLNGGGIFISGDNAVYNMEGGKMNGDKADLGGALYSDNAKEINISGLDLGFDSLIEASFAENKTGGAIYADTTSVPTKINVTNASFETNSANYGGAVCVEGKVVENNYVMSAGTSLNFTKCDFSGNTSQYDGGAIYVAVPEGFSNNSLFQVKYCSFESNTASFDGGAIAVETKEGLTPKNTEYKPSLIKNSFKSNVAGSNGGAVFINGGTNLLIDAESIADKCLFEQNSGLNGGDIYFDGGSIEIYKSQFTASADSTLKANYGGSLYCLKSTVTLKDVEFTNRKSSNSGGAIYCGKCNLTILSATDNRNLFKGNSAQDNGGAIYTSNCNVSVNGTNFISNATVGNATSAFGGGAVCCMEDNTAQDNLSVKFETCSFSENKTSKNGSAMYIHSAKKNASLLVKETTVKNNRSNDGYSCNGTIYIVGITTEIDDCEIKNNSALNGAGLYFASCSAKVCDSYSNNGQITKISENNASNSGGGIYASLDSSVTIEHTNLYNNGAESGGGIYSDNQSSVLVKSGTLINYNFATYGAGIYSNKGLALENGEISNNQAVLEGGGIYLSGSYSITGGTVSNNKATRGGGIYFGNIQNGLTVSDVTISNNNATEGGGVYLSSLASMLFASGEIIKNTSATGGGVYIVGELTVAGGKINGNGSEELNSRGGGLYLSTNGRLTVNSGEIKQNTAEKGYAVYTSGTLTVYGGQITENKGKLQTRGSAIYVNSGSSVFGKTAYVYGNTDYSDLTDDVFALDNTTVSLGIVANVPVSGFKLGIYRENESTNKIIVLNAPNQAVIEKIVYESNGYGLAYSEGVLILSGRTYITALENNVDITFKKFGSLNAELFWSYNCLDWHTVVWDNDSATVNIATLGGRLYFYGNMSGHSESNYFNITSSGEYALSGDISTIINKSGNLATIPDYAYYKLFDGSEKLMSVYNLGFTYTQVGDYAFAYMFNGCTSLVSAPELSVTNLSQHCYQGMFKDCENLINAPLLPATTLADYCYYGMFEGCTALKNAPSLMATEVKKGSYGNMFSGCTSLTQTPFINAETLNEHSFLGMFSGCVLLTNACELKPTVVPDYAYMQMFENCTSLRVSPKICATNISKYAVDKMFYGCSSLEVITVCFEEWTSGNSFTNWVNGVAEEGSFVCPLSLDVEFGVNRIPQDWVKSEKIMTVSASVNGEIVSEYYIGKPYGVTYIDFELPSTAEGYREGYRLGGWSYEENGEVYNGDKPVWQDEIIYAVWAQIPTITDINGQEVDEGQNTWYVESGFLFVVKSNLTLSGVCEVPIIFVKECEESNGYIIAGEATFNNLTVISQKGFGVRVENYTLGNNGKNFTINVLGNNFIDMKSGYNIDSTKSTATITGLYSAKRLFLSGDGSLYVETADLLIYDASLSAQNYAIFVETILSVSGDIEIEAVCGNAENDCTGSKDSVSIAMYGDTVYISGKEIIARAGKAISRQGAMSVGLKFNSSSDPFQSSPLGMYGGVLITYAGTVVGEGGIACAIYGCINKEMFDAVTIEGLLGDLSSCGIIFLQENGNSPLIFSCLPKILIERAEGEFTEYVLNPVYGTPVENLSMYSIGAYNLSVKDEMFVNLQWFNGETWVDSVYYEDEYGSEGLTVNIEDLIVRTASYASNTYGVTVTTTATTGVGTYKFRITNGLSDTSEKFLSVEFEIVIEKAQRVQPADIEIVSKTDTTIKIKAENDDCGDYEYTINGTTWVKGSEGYVIFTSLVEGTYYNIKVRAPETENYSQSLINGNCIIETYTHLDYVKIVANGELTSTVGVNPSAKLMELLNSYLAEIERCSSEVSVNEAKKNAQAKIYLFMQKEDKKEILESSIGQAPSSAMQVLIQFICLRIDSADNLTSLDKAFEDGEIDILRQSKKEELDTVVLSISTGTKEFIDGVTASKKIIDTATTKESVLSAWQLAETRIRFYAEKDGKIFEIENLVGDGEVSVELIGLAEKEILKIKNTQSQNELDNVFADAKSAVNLRIEKDEAKNSIDILLGERTTKELRIYAENLKWQIDNAESSENVSTLKEFSLNEVGKRIAQEDLANSKLQAKDEIYEIVSGAVSQTLKNAVQTALSQIENATTIEELQAVKASNIEQIESIIKEDAKLPLWAVMLIGGGALAFITTIYFIIVKNIRKFRPIKINRK